MPTLPGNPSLDQLRTQAKELVRAARRGDTGALERIGSVSGEVTLAASQLVIARVRIGELACAEGGGAGTQQHSDGAPDWAEVVRALLDAGASTDGMILEAGEVSQPSAEVASLLRARGVSSR